MYGSWPGLLPQGRVIEDEIFLEFPSLRLHLVNNLVNETRAVAFSFLRCHWFLRISRRRTLFYATYFSSFINVDCLQLHADDTGEPDSTR